MSAREYQSFGALARHFEQVEARLPLSLHEALKESAELVEATAKAEFGDYQEPKGPYPGWAVLAPSTLIDKWRHGWAPPDNPLVRTHALQNSIQHEVGDFLGGNLFQAVIGSTSDIMPYHEYGTSKMPSRPVLGPALFVNIEKIGVIIQKRIQKAFGGGV